MNYSETRSLKSIIIHQFSAPASSVHGVMLSGCRTPCFAEAMQGKPFRLLLQRWPGVGDGGQGLAALTENCKFLNIRRTRQQRCCPFNSSLRCLSYLLFKSEIPSFAVFAFFCGEISTGAKGQRHRGTKGGRHGSQLSISNAARDGETPANCIPPCARRWRAMPPGPPPRTPARARWWLPECRA